MNKNIRQDIQEILKETYISSDKKQEKLINYILDETLVEKQLTEEPISKVLWIPINDISPNSYNPNKIAVPEKRLLMRSMLDHGITLPLVVTFTKAQGYVLIDGYHRWNIIKKNKVLRKRLKNKVPVVILKATNKNEQIMATIRHNRAQGKHQIEEISEVVKLLSINGWSSEKIMEALGMDADEVLRLKQFKGLGELFKDEDYSASWM